MLHNNRLFREISKGHEGLLLLQIGHLKVTIKRNQAVNFVLTA